MFAPAALRVIDRNPENTVEKNEEEEFAKGPLSILYQAVKNNTKVGGVHSDLGRLGIDQRAQQPQAALPRDGVRQTLQHVIWMAIWNDAQGS